MQAVNYTLQEIASITGGEITNAASNNGIIKDILIDSRRLITPEDCIFIALITRKDNGHKYIEDAYNKGIRNFIVSEPEIKFKDSNYILVSNTLEALQNITAFHRSKFNIPVIGITGSNGKTIIKEWLFQLLNTDNRIVRSPKSYNSQVGVPLSVWQLRPNCEMGVFEAGISEPDEMGKLQTIIKPTIGIFSNIGPAHSENFISIQQKIGEML